MSLQGKNVLITGAARRLGRAMSLALAGRGASVIIHHRRSENAAQDLLEEIETAGGTAWILQADLEDPIQAGTLVPRAIEYGPLYALVNNASIFETFDWNSTDLDAWNRHLNTNLTAPFLICQSFARSLEQSGEGRIVNILDWRALRPGSDHFPYTISKAALAALTRSLASALSPNILVNGMALGAILPPSDGAPTSKIIENVPANRWAQINEVTDTLLFLLDGPKYITGEIIHVDGGRHLV